MRERKPVQRGSTRASEREAEGLGDVLDGLLAGRPWRSGLAVGELARRWVDVVGERLAAETSPARLDDTGVLFVRASSRAWSVQLRFLAEGIRRAANDALGEELVREVRVVVD